MHFRLKCNYETVIPPLRTFSTRWIVHAPQNNIDEGDVGVGGFNKHSCAAIRKEPAVATTDKYVQTKALAEKIVDRMALQSTPTYSVALQWMQEFYDALQGGDVPKFVMEVSPRIGLEELPQVSSGESTGLTQISIASSSSQTPSAAAAEGDTDDLEEKSAVPVQDESAADHDVQDEDARESGAPSTEEAERRPTSASSDTGPAQNSTEMVPEKPSEGSNDDPISFSQPPRVRGLSKREKRRIAG
ncbi:hypothetical protein PF007_g30614, partial [Phytophthora fragariae]